MQAALVAPLAGRAVPFAIGKSVTWPSVPNLNGAAQFRSAGFPPGHLNGGNTVMSDDASLLCDNIMRRTPPAPPQPADKVATASAKAQTKSLVSIASVSISRPLIPTFPPATQSNHRVIHPELAELRRLLFAPHASCSPPTAIAAGCSSGTRPTLVDVTDGGLSNGPCDVVLTCTPDKYGVCQHTCTPDPGPRLVNCSQAEQDYLFYDKAIWTFEEQATIPEPLARGMYSYTDNSAVIKTFTSPTTTIRPENIVRQRPGSHGSPCCPAAPTSRTT